MPTEDHSSQLLAEALRGLWVGLASESLGQLEELSLFPRFGFDSVLDKLHEHSR